MKNTIKMAVCAIAMLVTFLPMQGSAVAQTAAIGGANCTLANRGTSVSGIPDTKEKLVPSVRKQLSGYALQAKKNSCNIELVCVGASNSEANMEYARQACVVVRDAFIRAAGKGDWGKPNILVSRKAPGGSFAAGLVYITLR
jgi:hypothetical protein